MIPATIITWLLIIFGIITCGPLLYVQGLITLDPHRKAVKDIFIGKDKDWRDETHLLSAIGGSRADLLVFAPLFTVGTVGVLLGTIWGYVVYGAAGTIMVYANVMLWFQEKKEVYPQIGPMAYYSYYWGNFVYWGLCSLLYSLIRLNGISL